MSNLVSGVRSVVDAKGNFVTSRKSEAEEEEHVYTVLQESPVGNLVFEEIEDVVTGSDHEGDSDEDVDALLEYFADE